mgnify:CR=1 FL=1|jgi:Domain of unknown function (DU1801).
MAKSTNKTVETSDSVTAFIDAVPDETKRDDARRLITIMKNLTGFEPKMWGPSIIGFGSYHYKYATGREGDAPLTGFSPRKNELSIYLNAEFSGKEDLLQQLGKHKSGKGCLYIKKLQDIDEKVLEKLIKQSVSSIKMRNEK